MLDSSDDEFGSGIGDIMHPSGYKDVPVAPFAGSSDEELEDHEMNPKHNQAIHEALESQKENESHVNDDVLGCSDDQGKKSQLELVEGQKLQGMLNNETNENMDGESAKLCSKKLQRRKNTATSTHKARHEERLDMSACMEDFNSMMQKIQEAFLEQKQAEEASMAAIGKVNKQSVQEDRNARMQLKHISEELKELHAEIQTLSKKRLLSAQTWK